MPFPRASGILLHPTSFPSRFGIGDLGFEAYQFIDFLVDSGQQLWQILPLVPTGDSHSPVDSSSWGDFL
jgi:4-alpha-glucanotransferase